MSGGVDSSVAAALLAEQGHDVIGVSMQLYDNSQTTDSGQRAFGTCCTIDDLYDARRVAATIGIPHYIVNFEREFEKKVIENFVGEYTAGWIKRGPTGVIGTNKPDAAETVACMVEDLAADRYLHPAAPARDAVERLVRERQPRCFSYQDWLKLNELEVQRGKETGRPRVKFTKIEDMLAALGRR